MGRGEESVDCALVSLDMSDTVHVSPEEQQATKSAGEEAVCHFD
jgi:hypothetical protein